MKRILLTAAAACIGCAVASYANEKPAALDGAQLLEQRCSGCHSSVKAKKARKSAKEWEVTVTRMIGKGAKLSENEKKLLVDHLAATYAP